MTIKQSRTSIKNNSVKEKLRENHKFPSTFIASPKYKGIYNELVQIESVHN